MVLSPRTCCELFLKHEAGVDMNVPTPKNCIRAMCSMKSGPLSRLTSTLIIKNSN
jgi:hypothetical protein